MALSFLYNDDITIKRFVSGSDYDGVTYSEPEVIKGAIFDKRTQKTDGNGNLIILDNQLHTLETLQPKDQILYNGSYRDIATLQTVRNHLFGTIDHMEYGF